MSNSYPITIEWNGPRLLRDLTDELAKKTSDWKNPGIYMWLLKNERGWFVTYVGQSSRSVLTRLLEEIAATCGHGGTAWASSAGPDLYSMMRNESDKHLVGRLPALSDEEVFEAVMNGNMTDKVRTACEHMKHIHVAMGRVKALAEGASLMSIEGGIICAICNNKGIASYDKYRNHTWIGAISRYLPEDREYVLVSKGDKEAVEVIRELIPGGRLHSRLNAIHPSAQ